METKKVIEGVLGGMLFGFTAGIGFILATRIMTKKVVIESKSAPEAPKPEAKSDFSSFQDGELNQANDFMQNNKPRRQSFEEKTFDFSTGRYI
tara:strand:+ start:103 stop:381 length:279 start_codon:yes stop_codon:yes gene_type:complete